MKETVLKKVISMLLCAVMLVGVLPIGIYAEGVLSAEEKQAVLSRSMGSWIFPVAEEFFDDIADVAGCRGYSENVLYGSSFSECISYDHEASDVGNDGMDIRIPDGTEVYAPVDGWLVRSPYADYKYGNVVVIGQKVNDEYSYYIVLGHVSDSAPVASGSSVTAGSLVAYSDGSPLHITAVMAPAGSGDRIAANPSEELGAMGWLTQSSGTGLICVNPSRNTLSQHTSYIAEAAAGPIDYGFVKSAPVEIPTEHVHAWDASFISVEPTHFSEGEKTFVCACGEQRTESIPALAEHTYDQQNTSDAYLVSAGNCENPSVYVYSCICGAAGSETFTSGSAAGHAWDGGVITTQPTHSASGIRTYTCTSCGATRTEEVAADANHVYDQRVASEKYLKSGATCTSGAVYYYSCTCGAVGAETFTEGQAKGHSFASTYSSNGTHHWFAAVCGHEGEVSSFGEHTWDGGKVTVQPGHAVNGEKTFTCTTCGATRKETVMGESHVYDQEKAEEKYLKTAATCTEPAVYFKSCVCGEKGTETFTSGAAKGHTFSSEWSKDEKQHWQAATCAHTDQKTKVGDHIWDGGTITVQPTASTKGERTFTCVVCKQTRTEALEPTTHEHTFETRWTGNDSYHWHPASCEHTKEMSNFGEHVWDGGQVTVQATHTTKGEKIFTCTICGGKKKEVIDEPHVFDQLNTSSAFIRTSATCTSAPTYYKSCVCGAKGNDFFTSGYAAGHSFSGSWSKDESYHWHACAVCGAKGDITSHYFGAADTCTTCGQTRQGGHIHTSHLSRVPAKTSTCTQEGNIGYYVCDCGQWFTDVTATTAITDQSSVITPAAGHVDKDKNGKCDICKERIATETEQYAMTEGADSTWINTSSQGMVFRASLDYSKFDHVEVDGATVSSLNYTVSSGSTIVELNVNYMKRLTIGQHTISIVGTDGRANASFSVKQGSASTEKKGSSVVWIAVAVIAVLALVAAAVVAGYILYTGKSIFPGKKKKKGGKFAR